MVLSSQEFAPGNTLLAAKIANKGSSNMLPIPNLSFTGGAAGPALSGGPTPYNVTYGAKNQFGVFGFGAVAVIVIGYIIVKALK